MILISEHNDSGRVQEASARDRVSRAATAPEPARAVAARFWNGCRRLAFLFVFTGVAAAHPADESSGEVYLGPPIALTEEQVESMTRYNRPERGPASFESAETGDFSVDTSDRTDALSFYHCAYLPSEDFATRMGWVGDIASCNEGTVLQAFHDDTLRRINFYRAMVGLNSDITFDATKSAKCQKAGLIFARNCGLSHYPMTEHPEWSCLTTDGHEAAGNANISVSTGTYYCGPRIVDGQMEDAGVNNSPVGHRRWLLYSRAQEMGNGGVPDPANQYCSGGAIWVIGDFAPPPATPEWTSWPNEGYCPYPLVWPRWSFHLPGADFDNATVSMTQDGVPMTLTKIHPTITSPALGLGDASVVWEPYGLPTGAPTTDVTYSITIDNIADASTTSYTYNVIVFDPYDLNDEIAVSGPAQPVIGIDNTYTFNAINGATAYRQRERKFEASTWMEGGETGDPNRIIDGTHAAYPLIQSNLVYAGSRAFHMAFPDFVDQYFEMDRTLLPSATSSVEFQYRRRYSHVNNTIAVEVSANDGVDWTEVWIQTGICSGSCNSGYWDPSWISANVSLAAYAGLPIKVRFSYSYIGSAYIGSSSDYGVFFDNIEVTDAQDLLSMSTNLLPETATNFILNPDGEYTYVLDVQPELGCTWFEYGPATTVASAVGGTATIEILSVNVVGDMVQIDFGVQGGSLSTYTLEYSTHLGTGWQEDLTAVYDDNLKRFTTPMPTGINLRCYRVRGTAP